MRPSQLLAAAALWLGFAARAFAESPPAPAPGVTLEGGFAPASASIDPAGFARLRGAMPLWESWQGDDERNGLLRWGPFRLGDTFAAHVLGFPNDTTLLLGWEDAAGQRRLLAPRHPPEHTWTLARWAVPDDWRGREVWFFAEDRTGGGYGWLGVSAPVEASADWAHALRLIGRHALVFVLVLLPGAGAVSWLLRTRRLEPPAALALALTASAAAAYPLFFLYYWSAAAGRSVAGALLAGGAVAMMLAFRDAAVRRTWRALAGPLAVVYAGSLLYLAILFLYGGHESPELAALDRLLVRLPPDTALPMWVGDMLAAGQPPRGFLGDWLSSDRPPLQTSFYLLVHPLAGGGLGYQCLGTILQCWVFAAAWILLRAAGAGGRALRWTLFAAVFSGFFLFNGTFVWPKLLPAAFLLIAAAVLLFPAAGMGPRAGAFAGACAALAMLGHGGSVFGLFGLGVVSLVRPPPDRWRTWGAAVAAGLVLMLPWTLYQKFADPPGNRLLKWHLAGAIPVDPRPLGQALREAYAAKSAGELLRDRWRNVVMLAHRDETAALTGLRNAAATGRAFGAETGWRSAVYHLRELTFFHLLHSPQLALLGAAGWVLLWRRRAAEPAPWRLCVRLLALVAVTSLFWCSVMFEPGSTGNHQGSYFNNACLFAALGLGLAALPRAVAWVIGALHLVVFAGVWVHAFPHSHHTSALLPTWEAPMLALVLAAGAAALAAVARLERGTAASAAAPAATTP